MSARTAAPSHAMLGKASEGTATAGSRTNEHQVDPPKTQVDRVIQADMTKTKPLLLWPGILIFTNR